MLHNTSMPTVTVTQLSSSANSCQEFFQALYQSNSQNGYITFFRSQDRRVQYIALRDLEAVASYYIDRHPYKLSDMYFSLGIQADSPPAEVKSRGRAADIVALPALWFDLDCQNGEGTRRLPTRQEALDFLDFIPFPPSIVIDSGTGFHLYWVFRELWNLENQIEWETAAQLSLEFQLTLQEWAGRRGWQFDITADLSRVLRIPGTINTKNGEQREVHIIKLRPEILYNPSDFEGYLTDLIVKINKSGAGSVIMPREHLSIEPVLEGCHWFRHCIDDAATLPEPEWFAMLTILSKINDGYELVHRYSSPYPGYTQSETDRKFQHAGSFRNCYGCTKIEAISGGHYCTFCKHRGRNRTPLALSEEIAFRTELAEIKSIYMKGGGHDGQE